MDGQSTDAAKPNETRLERLERLRLEAEKKVKLAREKQAHIEREIKRTEAKANEAQRKAETRAKIIIGGRVLALRDLSSDLGKQVLFDVLKTATARDHDTVMAVLKARAQKAEPLVAAAPVAAQTAQDKGADGSGSQQPTQQG